MILDISIALTVFKYFDTPFPQHFTPVLFLLPPRGDDRWNVILGRNKIFRVCHGQFGLKSATARLNWCCLFLSVSRRCLLFSEAAPNLRGRRSKMDLETQTELRATQCSTSNKTARVYVYVGNPWGMFEKRSVCTEWDCVLSGGCRQDVNVLVSVRQAKRCLEKVFRLLYVTEDVQNKRYALSRCLKNGRELTFQSNNLVCVQIKQWR